jgi:opacity protein-like surface antigen
MKIKRINRVKERLAVSFLLLALQLAAFGVTSVGGKEFSIGSMVTYSSPNDADEGQWYGGAQARLYLSPDLELEGSIARRSNNYGGLTTVQTYPVQMSLLKYLMPGAGWSPFLLGGGGWYYTRVTGPVGFIHTSFRFGVHIGAGLEVMLNDTLSLDGSYRYVWLESVTSKDENALDKTYQDSGSMITIALNLLFGK